MLTNPAKLLLKWADIYDTRIKPSLFYDKYRFLNAAADITGNVHVYLPFTDNNYLLNDDNKWITHNILNYIDLLNIQG
ncbi:MAG: hypothetical protein RIS64_2334 [Bacteroidota bacterium]